MLREFVLLNTNLWISFMSFYMHVYHWPHQSSVKFSISYWSYARISFVSFYTHTHTYTYIYMIGFSIPMIPRVFSDLHRFGSVIFSHSSDLHSKATDWAHCLFLLLLLSLRSCMFWTLLHPYHVYFASFLIYFAYENVNLSTAHLYSPCVHMCVHEFISCLFI